MNEDIEHMQREICRKHDATYHPAQPDHKVGVAVNVREVASPINGLRHPPESDTTGWYIWAGEGLPDDPDFFKPLHVQHLSDWCPTVQRYLGLPPGWRFLIAGDYVDVWYDESLLAI